MTDGQLIASIMFFAINFVTWIAATDMNKERVHRCWVKESPMEVWQYLVLIYWFPSIIFIEIFYPIFLLLIKILTWKPTKGDRIR